MKIRVKIDIREPVTFHDEQSALNYAVSQMRELCDLTEVVKWRVEDTFYDFNLKDLENVFKNNNELMLQNVSPTGILGEIATIEKTK